MQFINKSISTILVQYVDHHPQFQYSLQNIIHVSMQDIDRLISSFNAANRLDLYPHFISMQQHIDKYNINSLMHNIDRSTSTLKDKYPHTSLWSCNKIGVLAIGEKPKAGMPSSRTYRQSVAAGKISGSPSSPPSSNTALFSNFHHGFESSVEVMRGRPCLLLLGSFCWNCKREI